MTPGSVGRKQGVLQLVGAPAGEDPEADSEGTSRRLPAQGAADAPDLWLPLLTSFLTARPVSRSSKD